MASLKDIPVIGESLYDLRQELHGNPDEVKANYDKQIEASKAAQEKQMQFLMGQKGAAQQFYAPMQNMFNRMYGTQGINAPQVPGAPGVAPISAAGGGRIQDMYQQQASAPPVAPSPRSPGGGSSYGAR
jgi:hypothetical protein